MLDPVKNLSPLDGRYGSKVNELRDYLSEFGLIKFRVMVEIEWLVFLCNTVKLEGTKILNKKVVADLRALCEQFDVTAANRVKEIEKTTNHDVKAVEYFIKENVKGSDVEELSEFIHFGCTSEDINNLSYSLMIKGALKDALIPMMFGVYDKIVELGKEYKNVAMMCRTHGQPATPSTMGKEFINVAARLESQLLGLLKQAECGLLGKINGAVGNYNAHTVVYPDVDWMTVSKQFVEDVLGLEQNLYTTQIEPHDMLAETFDIIRRFNTIVLDFDRDLWNYISLGYFKQKLKEGEVGSSTMPHKVNPIDFENSEGNLGLANAILSHLSEKLPVSRMQRDLTDSTVLRNVGVAFGYSVLAFRSTLQGLSKLHINLAAIASDLDDAWELMAEPIQMVMRRYKIPQAYEKLKALTRGKKIDKATVEKFIETLDLPKDAKKRLKDLTPSKYIGLASTLVAKYKPINQ